MKKLIIAAAIVCAAAFAQAATCTWGTGLQVKAPNADGSFGTSYLSTDSQFSIYVWLVDSKTYTDTKVADIWTNYGALTGSSGNNTIGKAQSATATQMKKALTATTDVASWSTEHDTPVYAIVLTTLDTDSDGKVDWYIANKAEGNVNSSGAGTDAINLAKNLGGGTGTAITGWTSAVPEPTSGLLLLIGMAGLALRRRRD